ncbi:hypothetical protein CerSpe_016550 [Prunus speciosa]
MANPDLPQPKKLRQTGQFQPRWEDLNVDCLANVFGRVGITALLLSVPFVCKSWYRASLDSACWQRLILPDVDTEIDLGNEGFWNSDNEIEAVIDRRPELFRFDTLMSRFEQEYQTGHKCLSDTQFITFVVKRSRGQAIFLRLPPLCQIALLNRVADVCHGVKGLSLHRCSLIYSSSIILELIGKCKHLELLSLRGGSNNLEELLLQISIHCKKFCRLLVLNAVIGREDALAIVNLVPNLKYLSLRKSYIHRDNLITLFRGCKELVLLDTRDCSGFDGGDVEILALASQIDKFSCEGSRNGDWNS